MLPRSYGVPSTMTIEWSSILFSGQIRDFEFKWLPWQPLFESEDWWVVCPKFSYPSCIDRLDHNETQKIVDLFLNHPELAKMTGEQTLRGSINSVIWANLPRLELEPEHINILFDQIMTQIEELKSCPDHRLRSFVLSQLQSILKAQPDVQKWTQQRQWPSIIHYCVEKDLLDFLEVFLDGTRAEMKALINLSFRDGHTPLDKARKHKNVDMQALLEKHFAVPSQASLKVPARKRRPSRNASVASIESSFQKHGHIASGRSTPVPHSRKAGSSADNSSRPRSGSQKPSRRPTTRDGHLAESISQHSLAKDLSKMAARETSPEITLDDSPSDRTRASPPSDTEDQAPEKDIESVNNYSAEPPRTASLSRGSSYAAILSCDLDRDRVWPSPPMTLPRRSARNPPKPEPNSKEK